MIASKIGRVVTIVAVVMFAELQSERCVARGEVIGDLSLLSELAELQSANLARLHQWAGTAELTFHQTEAARTYDFTQRVAVVFSQDFDRDAVCFRWTVLESQASMDGEQNLENSLQGARVGALHIGEDQYKMSLTSPSDPFTVTVSARTKPNIGDVSQIFYPESYLRIRGDDSADFFAQRMSIATRDWAWNKIEQDGDLVTLTSRNKTLEGVQSQYIFDRSKGGCLVEWNSQSPHSSGSHTTEYELIEGVYLPSTVIYRNTRNDGSETSEKVVRWTMQEVNKPFPDTAFTLSAMGVPAGATVMDRRLMTSYTFQPDTADSTDAPDSVATVSEPPKVATSQAQSVAETSDRSKVLLGIGLFGLGILVAILMYRRKRGTADGT